MGKLKAAMDDAAEKAERRIAWYNRFVEDARRDKKEIKGFFRANGANVPIREGETKRDALSNLNAKHSSKQEGKAETSQSKKVRGVNELSPRGANTFTVRGFRNKQKLNNHWKNGRTHRDEYPEFKTAEEYEAAALKLPESPCGGDITGHLDKEGNVIRYNKATNDFAKGHPDRGVTSMYKPVDGAGYYESQRKKDLEHGGRN